MMDLFRSARRRGRSDEPDPPPIARSAGRAKASGTLTVEKGAHTEPSFSEVGVGGLGYSTDLNNGEQGVHDRTETLTAWMDLGREVGPTYAGVAGGLAFLLAIGHSLPKTRAAWGHILLYSMGGSFLIVMGLIIETLLTSEE